MGIIKAWQGTDGNSVMGVGKFHQRASEDWVSKGLSLPFS